MHANIQRLADSGCILVFMHLLAFSTNIAMSITIYRVTTRSSRPVLQKIDSLLPMILMVAYYYLTFTYCEVAWRVPGIILFISGSQFCLFSTKLIVNTVTKQPFSTFSDISINLPFLFSIIMYPLHAKWSSDESSETK